MGNAKSADAAASEKAWAITAAIDFGTSNSGYAFVYGDDPDQRIITNKWQISKETKTTTEKAPTSVLFRPDKTFHSFGYEAEEKYARLCDTKQQAGWRYFRRFKMLLYKSKKLSLKTRLNDEENKSMRAIRIFAAVIYNLKERLLNEIRLEKEDVKVDDILFVITVPAIWSDAAKQFMREAATQAGIQENQLRLALEPEAASVMCTQLKPCRKQTGPTVKFEQFPVGHKYIVADLGGGTADIATHEVIEGGRLNEIYNALGDDLGSAKFDDEFLEFLSNLFGDNLFDQWRTTWKGDFLYLQRMIEGMKWSISTDDEDVILRIPHTLLTVMTTIGESLEDRLKQHDNRDAVTVSITDGGLSKSAYVRDCIEKEFSTMKILVPEDSGLSVMKGAVMLGNRPHTIAGRIARYTYGIDVAPNFIEGKHCEGYKFTRDGEVLCNHVFCTIIEKGTVMRYGQRFSTKTYIRASLEETKQSSFRTYLYQSTQKSPEYTTDPGCTLIGSFDKEPPEGGWPDHSESVVDIIVGEAEFQFRIKSDVGQEKLLNVDFILPN